MESKGWWSEGLETEMLQQERAAVLTALETAENRPKPPMGELFEDVYEVKPEHLERQYQELKAHVAKFPEHYESKH